MFYYREKRLVIRDVGHAVPIMDVTDESLSVHDRVQRHAPQLEQIDLLLVDFGNLLARVGQAGKGEMVFLPEAGKFFRGIRPDGQDFRIPRGELGITISQAR